MKKELITGFCFLILLSTFPMVMAWEMERPSDDVNINKRMENNLAGPYNEASVGIGVEVHKYEEDATWHPFNGSDGFIIEAVATANTREGIELEYEYEFHDYLYEYDLSLPSVMC
jgi:hypothetical protein